MSERKPKILYVDDDPDFLDAMRALLEAAGYEMVGAQTAEEGLLAFRESRPELVIVDLMMEEVDSGASFVKELRTEGSDVPVFMLSSVGDNLNLSADPAQLGLAGIFQKPVDRESLLAVLKVELGV